MKIVNIIIYEFEIGNERNIFKICIMRNGVFIWSDEKVFVIML